VFVSLCWCILSHFTRVVSFATDLDPRLQLLLVLFKFDFSIQMLFGVQASKVSKIVFGSVISGVIVAFLA
jgi:hypothetical protein